MYTAFDLLRAAQSGAMIASTARKWGLNDDQIQHMIQAMLPAFACGLQRFMTDPSAMERMVMSYASGGAGLMAGSALWNGMMGGHGFGGTSASKSVPTFAGFEMMKSFFPFMHAPALSFWPPSGSVFAALSSRDQSSSVERDTSEQSVAELSSCLNACQTYLQDYFHTIMTPFMTPLITPWLSLNETDMEGSHDEEVSSSLDAAIHQAGEPSQPVILKIAAE
jgi:hypothetical protein